VSAGPGQGRASGDRVFFPLAAAYGALAVPAWLAAHAAGWTQADAALHAHEMLLGYAPAAMAGFLTARVGRGALLGLVLTWIAARAAALAPLPHALAPHALVWAAALSFPACLFAVAGWPFLRSLKGMANAAFGPVLAALLLAEAAFLAGAPTAPQAALHAVSLMMLAMGGRILPAVAAGALRARGLVLADRGRRPLEWAGLAALGLAGVLAALDAAAPLGAAASALAAATVLMRLVRWRPLSVLDRPEVWALHLGWAWLGVGIALTGLGRVWPPLAAAGWHAVGPGALGTLAAAVMVRTALQRARLPVVFPAGAVTAVLLASGSACLRLAGTWAPEPMPWLAAAAAAWALSQALVLVALLRVHRGAGARRP
jgi:uncharacterized protein involved in response to NO